ncbi:MAG: 30S ribosomal protein S6 [Lachnospirales bacterium]
MNKYELALVVKANLDEEATKAEFEKVNQLIARFGGEIVSEDMWGKRRLAYEIQKQHEGIYNFIKFNAPATAPAEIESRLRISENLLRFLIFRVEA